MYVEALQDLVDKLGAGSGAVVCKRFFSGAAAYADGHIFMTLTPVGLALKLPAAERAALLDNGGAPLRYFPKAPIKKQYVVVPEAIAEDLVALAPLVGASMVYVAAQK